AAAPQERPARPLAQHHRLAALVADVLRRHRRAHRLALGVEVHRGLALRVAAAAEERPAPPHPLDHRLAALGALVLRRLRRLFLAVFGGAALLDVVAAAAV